MCRRIACAMQDNGTGVIFMETVQIRLTEKQIKAISALVKKGIYPNRSEAVRDAVRKLVDHGA